MRHIVLTALFLGLPLAAAAQEEEQDTGAQQQQTQDDTQQQGQQAQDQQQSQEQSGEGVTQDDRAFGRQSRTVAAEPEDMSAEGAGGEAEVARAQFTSEVQDREPVDQASDFSTGQDPLYFFTEVKNGAGQTITHRWLRDGEVMAEVPLNVGSDSWRTWSSKEMMPEWEGEWTVEVVDAQGQVLAEESISVDAGTQAQNAGFSPDEQGAATQQTSGQGASTQTREETGMDESAQQSSGTEDEEDWQGDALPEEIDYETTDEATTEDGAAQDEGLDEDGSGDNPKQDGRY